MTISTSEVKYGKCPQCGESYQINGDPHFCPPKRRLPTWLKSQLIGKTEEFIKIKHLDSYQEGYDDAINWVLSLEECDLNPQKRLPVWLKDEIEDQIDELEMICNESSILKAQRDYAKAQFESLKWVLSLEESP